MIERNRFPPRMDAVLLILLPIQPVLPSTHWMVTESGKIEAQPDSFFFIRQPHDLVAFIHQEQRVQDTNSLHESLSSIRGALDAAHSAEVPDVEAELLAEDPDCLLAGRPLTQYDLYVSTMVPLRSPVLDSMEMDSQIFIDETVKLKEPWCSTKEIMQEINLPAIDNLKSLIDRHNLSMQGEIGLAQIVLLEGRIELSHYAHLVAYALNKEKTNWVIYNLAALYWRMKGNAYEGIECLRRAIYFGQEESLEARPVSLISLGNVLHQSLQPEDAAKVLEMAVDNDPTESVGHYTLGNVYAVLMQFNKSIASFDYALKISPDLPWVAKRKSAVKCHQKLEASLENQHRKLQKTLEELRAYQKQHEKWVKMNNKLNSVQAPLEQRVASRLSYEQYTLLTAGRTIRAKGCYETLDNGKKFVECVVNSLDPSADIEKRQIIYRRNSPTPHKQDEEEIEELENTSGADDKAEKEAVVNKKENKGEVFGPENKPSDYQELDRNKPSQKKKYPSLKNRYGDKKKYDKEDWPSKEECKKYVSRFPDWSQLPSVYLPVKNKGFSVETMITSDIGVSGGTPHPLPWYPPVCHSSETVSEILPSRYTNLAGLRPSNTREKFPDESIKEKLLDSFGQGEQNENIAELGARLKSARETGTWPQWLLSITSANYWRVIGNVVASIDCYLLALAEVPSIYRDLVLTNMGALMYRLGHIDSALKLVQESVGVCSTEPETHFLLANLLAAKGNMTGSISHYRTALSLEPSYPYGVEQLRIPSCYVKYQSSVQDINSGPASTSCGGDFFSRDSPPTSCSSLDGDKDLDSRSLTSIQDLSEHCSPQYQCCKAVQCGAHCSHEVSNSCNIPVNTKLTNYQLVCCEL